jgi:formylglycine-generating enzyme required for sulfatase activity
MKNVIFSPSLFLCLVGLAFLSGCGKGNSQTDDWKMPTLPAATPEVLNLMKRAHLALEESDWQQATEHFEKALNLDAEYAPAYTGKLCAELKLRSEAQLADSSPSISDMRNFQLALRFADAAYKTKLEGYVAEIKKRRGNAGERKVLTIKNVEYAFRWCPAGKFQMGDERNTRQVTLSRGFWLLETEVTQGMWESVMGNNPSEFKGAKLPVETVSWNDCQEYVKKLNDLKVAPAGFKFSLPTEAQWEYACRAGTTTAYSFGDTLTQQQANFSSEQTTEVGKYPANAWGLKDMHGNVWEWCLDWYGEYPSGAVTDPTGADEGSSRVVRGGSWNAVAGHCRSAIRDNYGESDRGSHLGIRLSLVSQ